VILNPHITLYIINNYKVNREKTDLLTTNLEKKIFYKLKNINI